MQQQQPPGLLQYGLGLGYACISNSCCTDKLLGPTQAGIGLGVLLQVQTFGLVVGLVSSLVARSCNVRFWECVSGSCTRIALPGSISHTQHEQQQQHAAAWTLGLLTAVRHILYTIQHD